MASERVVSFFAAQASMALMVLAGMREDTIGSRPVAGRPRPLFWSTFIDFFMILGLRINASRGEADTSTRL
jgi:hypothetical protein